MTKSKSSPTRTQDYHLSPEEAAEFANDAGVRALVYQHLSPAPDNPLMRRLFTSGVDPIRPSHWAIAEDGDLYTLPIGSTGARVGNLD